MNKSEHIKFELDAYQSEKELEEHGDTRDFEQGGGDSVFVNEVGIDDSVFSLSQKIKLEKVRDFSEDLVVEYRSDMRRIMKEYQKINPSMTDEIIKKIIGKNYDTPEVSLLGKDAFIKFCKEIGRYQDVVEDFAGEDESIFIVFQLPKPLARFWYRGGDGSLSVPVNDGSIEWGELYRSSMYSVYDTYDKYNDYDFPILRINDLGDHDPKKYYYLWMTALPKDGEGDIRNSTEMEVKIREFGSRQLTDIENKTRNGKDLSVEELRFIYGVDQKIKYFELEDSLLVQEILKTRNLEEDAPLVFGLHPDQIAYKKDDIDENTRVYIGSLEGDVFKRFPNTISYIFTSFPDERIDLDHIKIKSTSKAALKYDLSKVMDGEEFEKVSTVLDSEKWFMPEDEKQLTVVKLSIKQLELDSSAALGDIFKKAESLGLTLCPRYLAPHYYLKYRGVKDGIFGGRAHNYFATKPVDYKEDENVSKVIFDIHTQDPSRNKPEIYLKKVDDDFVVGDSDNFFFVLRPKKN